MRGGYTHALMVAHAATHTHPYPPFGGTSAFFSAIALPTPATVSCPPVAPRSFSALGALDMSGVP